VTLHFVFELVRPSGDPWLSGSLTVLLQRLFERDESVSRDDIVVDLATIFRVLG
jgi:hypothetical protein